MFSSWNTYHDPQFGYSLQYPDAYEIVIVNTEQVEIGDQIVLRVDSLDPTTPRGGGTVIESTSALQVSGYPAQLLTGYIGAVGGYIPQQYRRVVVEWEGSFLVMTLYALGLHATEGNMTEIIPMDPEDVVIFDQIVMSVQIP
jgi:hypothetical protein